MGNRYFQARGVIQAICPQNDIVEIDFIMDRSELHFSFHSIFGDGLDIYRFPHRK